MTKAELIGVMADEAGITKVAAADALDAYVAAVTKELKKIWEIGIGWIWHVLRRQKKSKRGQESSNRKGY